MGNCDSLSDPGTTNSCSPSLGSQLELFNFATITGPLGDTYANTWCQKLGSPGEWIGEAGGGEPAGYSDCNLYQVQGFGCCNGCCGITPAAGGLCTRVGFNGDPLTCCLQDYICSTGSYEPGGHNFNSCFSDPQQKDTCAPQNQSIVTSACQSIINPYCSGADIEDPADTSWIGRWIDVNGDPVPGGCYYALRRNLFSFPNSTNPNKVCSTGPPIVTNNTCTPVNTDDFPVNADGYFATQELVQATIAKYVSNGFVLGALPGTAQFNQFQDFIYQNICCMYPGLCQNGLQQACSIHTAQRISLNPLVGAFCGCYLPNGEYQTYVNSYGLNKECTPTCNQPNSIPVANGDGSALICTQSSCILDNVNLNIINSSVAGGITTAQFCSSCTTSTGVGVCSCISENNTIDIINEQVAGSANLLSQVCQSTTCTQTNPIPNGSPSIITVPCMGATGNPFENEIEAQAAANAQARRNQIIKILILVIIVVLVLVVIFFIIGPNLNPSDKFTKKMTIQEGLQKGIITPSMLSTTVPS